MSIDNRTITVVPRPVLGQLRFDSGMVVQIDRPLVVGRKPAIDVQQHIGEVPGLVTVVDADAAISRVHADVRLEGWEVLVVDRASTHGTFVELPGQERVRLHPWEPFLIVPGTHICLADAMTCSYEIGF